MTDKIKLDITPEIATICQEMRNKIDRAEETLAVSDKEYARHIFIQSIRRALDSFTYEEVDEVFLYVMQIYKKRWS